MASIAKLVPPAPLTPEYLRHEYNIGLHYERTHDGLLPMTPFFDYERARRAINPSRFDFYHPSFGRLLRHEEEAILRHHHPIVVVPTSNPPVVSSTTLVAVPFPIVPTLNTPSTPAPIPGGMAVPEPSSGLMLAGALALAWVACRVRGRAAR